jgi:hypothetical protein
LDGVLGLAFYNQGALNGAFPKPNSTENSDKVKTDAQNPGNERFTPQIPRLGRFSPSAALRPIQETAGMTSGREQVEPSAP